MPLIPGDSEIDQIFKIFRWVAICAGRLAAICASFQLGILQLTLPPLVTQPFYLEHSLLGTPTPEIWPNLVNMPDFRPQFPKWRAQNLKDVVPEMDATSRDLLSRMLVYDPMGRISGASQGGF